MTPRRIVLLLPALLSLLLMVTPAAAEEPDFIDTVDTSYEEAVAALAEAGIVNGCEEDKFCARDALSRGQMATILVGALEFTAEAEDEPDDPSAEHQDAPEDHFSDIADSTHREAINLLAEEGLANGCGDGKYCPHDSITREQLSSLLFRGFELPDAPADETYFDDVSETHGEAVNGIAANGISNGCTLVSFCSGDTIQRAHAAVFVARTLELVEPADLAPFDERKAEHEEKLAELADQLDPAAEKAVEVALAQLGKPYQWGGSGPNSFDCSGLTSYAWAAAGVDLPRTSGAQYSGTTRISRDELREGDLVFYHDPISHVAMYIGDGKVVEAPNSGNNVRIREDGLTRNGVVGFGRP